MIVAESECAFCDDNVKKGKGFFYWDSENKTTRFFCHNCASDPDILKLMKKFLEND